MDRLRTLLLARTHVVVMDPDAIADASTRPSRDADVQRLEDELAQLGFVMSLDLAATLRRLPGATLQELRGWIATTLGERMRVRPQVPLARYTSTDEPPSAFARRMLTWLATSAEHPCPWCGELRAVGALDPCGHLVCRACWDNTGFTGCPVCARRVTLDEPFMRVPEGCDHVRGHNGTLSIVHLGFDLVGTTKLRFERLLARTRALSAEDRAELESILDTIGPRAASWLPASIPVRETMAYTLARLWSIAADRAAIVRDTRAHVRDATDLLRITAVLMQGNAELVEPMRLGSISRGLRRSVLGVLDALPFEQTVEEMSSRCRLWKRIGERLHPFELADTLPTAALAFAVVRKTKLSALTMGPALRERAVQLPCLYLEDDVIKLERWRGPIEDALRAGNPRSALVRLTHRPPELLRRADHLVRLAQARQPDALQTILKAVELAATKGPPAEMLALAAHVARRARPWKRRVFFPGGQLGRGWSDLDRRPPLRGDAIAVMVGSIRRQLCARAELNRHFARAVIDRALVDILVPRNERPSARTAIVWPRGSEIALPDGQQLRLWLHAQNRSSTRAHLALTLVLFDREWQHVATWEDLGGGDTAHVDLHIEQLTMMGVRHAVLAATDATFVAITPAPDADVPVDPRTIWPRFDLGGRAVVKVPLSIDISERRLRWLDVRLADRSVIDGNGGLRATLAHVARDLGDVIGMQARPTMWDVACIHAAARANVVYIRERDGSFTTYRRRDNESKAARLGRLMSGAADDGRVSALPASDAPMWFALVSAMALPRGSVGFVLDARALAADGVERLSVADLIAELALRAPGDLPPKRSP